MKIVVLIVSDRCYNKEKEDKTSPLLIKYISQEDPDANIINDIVPDDKERIKEAIETYVFNTNVDIILTSGGTGFGKRDITPEVTKEIIEKEAPGIMEFLRSENYKNNKFSYLSRGICGIVKETIIVNLPGSPQGAVESYKIIKDMLYHASDLLKKRINNCDELNKL